jgi:hypothetical protein
VGQFPDDGKPNLIRSVRVADDPRTGGFCSGVTVLRLRHCGRKKSSFEQHFTRMLWDLCARVRTNSKVLRQFCAYEQKRNLRCRATTATFKAVSVWPNIHELV